MRTRAGSPSSALFLVVCVPAWAAGPGADIPAVNSRLLDIEFSVRDESPPLMQVELWVTSDEGGHWNLHPGETGTGPGWRCPIRLRVEQDGVYGLYLVLRSATGSSAESPTPGQSPQQWVLVDTSAPLVQIKQVQVIERPPPESSMLVVAWTAYDAHLSERPVALYYQLAEQPGWLRMAGGVPNIGRFDWPVPAEIGGGVQVKAEVIDGAGNSATDVSAPVVITSRAATGAAGPIDLSATSAAGAAQAAPAPQFDPHSRKSDPEKAQKLYELGLWHKQRGDYAIALERLVEAMNLDPRMAAPAFELADIYYVQGDYHGALDLYQGILGQRPSDRDALRGSALAMVALGKYPEALDNLESVLRNLPEDAETWLHAGDVFLMMGQSAQARQYWSESLRLNPKKSDLATQARKRLEKYALDAKNR